MQSIDDGAFVDINGVPQWLTLRGGSANPALLLIGGPGFGTQRPGRRGRGRCAELRAR